MLPIKQTKNKNDSKLSNSLRNSAGFAAVSSQFHIVHTYDSHPTKGELKNAFMKAISPRF